MASVTSRADYTKTRAYVELQRLPLNTPEFEYERDGAPVVHLGEYICCMKKTGSQSLCSQLHGGKYYLIQHLEKDHHQIHVNRRAGQGGSDGRKQARDFYDNLMKDENYDDGMAETQDDAWEDEEVGRPEPSPVQQTDQPHITTEVSVMGREREDPIDLTSSPEPEQVKVEEGAATGEEMKRQSAQKTYRGAGSIKEEANSQLEPRSPDIEAAQSVDRLREQATSQTEKRPPPDEDSDEDLELELKKTDLELKRIELQQKLKEKRRVA